ncbi:hypothetical protein CALVIDRAFT_532164 [Calocera viscosa TUFC12733]|uniref:HIG1 domain-containing protein n=1 Tax=Calocera viscosa (strain TUFC12733) TaxID=1330018 RepID=A0A167RYA4_CALVF|nr:hypothetical protein CALVIDRAFT_532164 [Calocera viscosa TUFC12733]
MSFPQHVPPSDLQETYVQKGWRKCKEQPVVPLGVLLTCIAFLGATRSLRSGDKASFNRYLRFRVLAQGLTIVGCVAGAYWIGRESRLAGKEKQKEAVRRGEWGLREGGFDEGLKGRMREAERIAGLEREADERLGIAGAAVPLSLNGPAGAGAGAGKTSAEVNAALARARARENPPEQKSREVLHEPMRIGALLSADQLKQRLEKRGRGQPEDKVDEDKRV